MLMLVAIEDRDPQGTHRRVTVVTFDIWASSSDDCFAHCVLVGTLESRRRYEGPKKITIVARIAAPKVSCPWLLSFSKREKDKSA